MSEYAICFLATNVNNDIFIFAETLKQANYDIYICIDNNDAIIPDYNADKINVIRISNDESKLNGFTGCVLYCLNRPCARDKALYYFCKHKMNYDYVWFVEEDVFIPDKDTIKNLDQKYIHGDLLCESCHIKKSKNHRAQYWDHWSRLADKVDYPWAHSMICAVRVSKLLLKFVSEFVTQNKFLLFDEALFNTLALQNNLKIINPKELSTIKYSTCDFIITKYNFNRSYLYHPIKNISIHKKIRETYQ